MTAVKIGVIGAGSAVFSLGLVRDLCLHGSLAGSCVTFMDVHEQRLRMIHRLAQRYAEELGSDLRFEATLEREGALRDASFVLNTAFVGGHDVAEQGRRVAEDHGYYRGFRFQTNFHQFDLMLALARDMERICPSAWLIESANPVFDGCTLMTRHTGVKVIGLCHGYNGYRHLAEAIGVPADEVEWEAPGVNHWIYLTQFRHEGRDLYPRIDAWIREGAPALWESTSPGGHSPQLSRAAVDLYHRLGRFPIGDTARAGGWDPRAAEWYYHTDLATKQHWFGLHGGADSEIGWERYLRRNEERIAQIQRVATDQSARVTAVIPPERTREIQVPIIDAIASDNPGIFQVNVPNNGAIAGVADDVVIEGKALVDASGARLLHVGALPDKLMRLALLPRIAATEKELLAYTSGDRDVLVSCLLDDHRTRSLQQAEGAVDALLSLPWNAPHAERFAGRSA